MYRILGDLGLWEVFSGDVSVPLREALSGDVTYVTYVALVLPESPENPRSSSGSKVDLKVGFGGGVPESR